MSAAIEAEQLAFDFLMDDLTIPDEDREWFGVIDTRLVQDAWYVVTVGIEGLPDKWVLQVYDTGDCDPNYTFVSPMTVEMGTFDLEDLPEAIAVAIASERAGGRLTAEIP